MEIQQSDMQRFVQQNVERQRLIDSLKADLRKTTQEYFDEEVLLSHKMDKVSLLNRKCSGRIKCLTLCGQRNRIQVMVWTQEA